MYACLLAEANPSLVGTASCWLDSLSDRLRHDRTAGPLLEMEKETHSRISGSVDWADCHAEVAAASRCTAGTCRLGGQDLIDYSEVTDCRGRRPVRSSPWRPGGRGRGRGRSCGGSGGVDFMMHPSGGRGKIRRGPSMLQPGAFLLWKAVD